MRKRIDTSHGSANNSRLGEGGEVGEVFFEKTDPGFGCCTSFRRHRANLKRTQIQIGQIAKEHAAAPQEDTQLQDLISSKCGAKHKLLWLSVQRKPSCTAA